MKIAFKCNLRNAIHKTARENAKVMHSDVDGAQGWHDIVFQERTRLSYNYLRSMGIDAPHDIISERYDPYGDVTIFEVRHASQR